MAGEVLKALIELEGHATYKRFKMQGFNMGPVTGNATNPVKRSMRIQYDGPGVFLIQNIVVNCPPNSNWAAGGNIRPNLCKVVIRNRNDELIIPDTGFYNAMNNFSHWAYDNVTYGVNLCPQEYLTLEAEFTSAGSRWIAGAISGVEYLFSDLDPELFDLG